MQRLPPVDLPVVEVQFRPCSGISDASASWRFNLGRLNAGSRSSPRTLRRRVPSSLRPRRQVQPKTSDLALIFNITIGQSL